MQTELFVDDMSAYENYARRVLTTNRSNISVEQLRQLDTEFYEKWGEYLRALLQREIPVWLPIDDASIKRFNKIFSKFKNRWLSLALKGLATPEFSEFEQMFPVDPPSKVDPAPRDEFNERINIESRLNRLYRLLQAQDADFWVMLEDTYYEYLEAEDVIQSLAKIRQVLDSEQQIDAAKIYLFIKILSVEPVEAEELLVDRIIDSLLKDKVFTVGMIACLPKLVLQQTDLGTKWFYDRNESNRTTAEVNADQLFLWQEMLKRSRVPARIQVALSDTEAKVSKLDLLGETEESVCDVAARWSERLRVFTRNSIEIVLRSKLFPLGSNLYDRRNEIGRSIYLQTDLRGPRIQARTAQFEATNDFLRLDARQTAVREAVAQDAEYAIEGLWLASAECPWDALMIIDKGTKIYYQRMIFACGPNKIPCFYPIAYER